MLLETCLKQHTRDLDKALPPAETVRRVKEILSGSGTAILRQTRRIDTGRLGIPVYISVCGPEAREVMPTRKQMGKGASPEQAEASALMELVERYSLFSYFQRINSSQYLTWSKAKQKYGSRLIPVSEILHSTQESLSPDQALQILDLTGWHFCPALRIDREQEVLVPLNWFKILNEFNGSSAGNTSVESILQGGCELVERHVCAEIERSQPVLPSIDPGSVQDPVLQDLLQRFARNGIKVLLKDFSLDLGVPTVGALAFDPETFPDQSEIVFTAGTASEPDKAAIRALTEIAQLAGDFETRSRYEPSGLSKYTSPQEFAWLQEGPLVPLNSLPDIGNPDLLKELKTLARELEQRGFSLYSIDTAHPDLGLAANYNFVPGFGFRERTEHGSLGLFTGRILAEQASPAEAQRGFRLLDRIYPENHFVPFFRGLVSLRREEIQESLEHLSRAEQIQPSAEDRSLVAFYQGYALTRVQEWTTAVSHLERAVRLAPDSHAGHNLLGVAHFKLGDYEKAARNFHRAIDIDKGSALDRANLGLCYKNLGQEVRAVEFLNSSLELDPGLDFARQGLQEIMEKTLYQ
ncbi:MAG: YcaO-like family protein [Desulfohalobiaceae bacterium]|nr:YcaO-like family protein [Desulfohalobiaceae bacterium]